MRLASEAPKLLSAVVACTALLCFSPSMVRSEDVPSAASRAAAMLPSSVVALAEFPRLADSIQTIMQHPLRERLQGSPAYTAMVKSEPFKRLQMGVAAFEGSMQRPWQEALQALTDGGLTIALTPENGGSVAVLLHSSDPQALERLQEFVLGLQVLAGKSANQASYRELTVYDVAKGGRMVVFDNWLLLVNKPQFGKAIIDQYLDHDRATLHDNPKFAQAQEQLQLSPTGGPSAWAYLDVEALRSAGLAKPIFRERLDNYFGELVLGGVLSNLRQTPFATLALDLEPSGISLQATSPHDRQWEAPREYFFGEDGSAAAPPLLQVDGRLFAVSSHRDLSQLWLRSGDLLGDKVLEQMAQADTRLTTFFSGLDFGEDILGAMEPGIQLVGKVQTYADDAPVPAVKFPTFAMQLRMKDPAGTRSELRRVFQSFVGFLNVTGAQNGQPPLDLGMESVGSAQLYTATYVPNRDMTDRQQAPIFFNFSPTIAFVGDHFILSSTTSLARELCHLDTASAENAEQGTANTLASVDAEIGRRALEVNRTHLVANNMLEKGHSQEAAEAEIGLLLEFIDYFNDANFSLDVTDHQMQMNLKIDVDSDKRQPKDVRNHGQHEHHRQRHRPRDRHRLGVAAFRAIGGHPLGSQTGRTLVSPSWIWHPAASIG